jgi:hypothetical protein
MTTIITGHWPTRDGNTYITAAVAGVPYPVRWEAPGSYADEAAMIAAVDANQAPLVCDAHRRAYPLAVIVRQGEDEAKETELAAWERVLAAGTDDAGVALTERTCP